MTRDIHSRLGERMEEQTELSDLARYTFQAYQVGPTWTRVSLAKLAGTTLTGRGRR